MAGKWAYLHPSLEGENQSFIVASGTATCDGTGTATTVTFADENLPELYDTAYQAFLCAHAASQDLCVTTKATTSMVVTHANNSTETFDYLILGKKK